MQSFRTKNRAGDVRNVLVGMIKLITRLHQTSGYLTGAIVKNRIQALLWRPRDLLLCFRCTKRQQNPVTIWRHVHLNRNWRQRSSLRRPILYRQNRWLCCLGCCLGRFSTSSQHIWKYKIICQVQIIRKVLTETYLKRDTTITNQNSIRQQWNPYCCQQVLQSSSALLHCDIDELVARLDTVVALFSLRIEGLPDGESWSFAS